MANSGKSASPPKGLLLLAVVGAVGAVAYAFLGSGPTGPPGKSSAPPSAVAPIDLPPPGASLDVLVSTGNTRMDSGRYQSAIAYYSRALELDSSQVDVWVDRGACRHAIGQGTEARGDFAHALRLDPKHVIAMFNMGVAYMTDSREDSARVWWKRLLVESPTGLQADRARELLAHLDSLHVADTP